MQTLTTLQNKSILVVDDDADTRDLLQVVLQQAGAEVIPAESVDCRGETFPLFSTTCDRQRHSPAKFGWIRIDEGNSRTK